MEQDYGIYKAKFLINIQLLFPVMVQNTEYMQSFFGHATQTVTNNLVLFRFCDTQ